MGKPREKMPNRISLRPATDDDREFLLRVYEFAREIELSSVPWDETMKRSFVEQQFEAQVTYYLAEYPAARHDVIILSESGEPVGRLYVNRTTEQIAILDFTVLPNFRGRGVGSSVVRELIAEAHVSGRAVQVYVETFNPSRLFFINRGFEEKETDGINTRFVWDRKSIE